jgi:DNA-directed RNA polymerase II subunit RPB2
MASSSNSRIVFFRTDLSLVCDICGLMTPIARLKKNTFECKNCSNKSKISQVHIPYAAKLLFQELQSMNIAARLYTRGADEK